MTTMDTSSRARRVEEDARREAELSAYEAITRQPRRDLSALTALAATVTGVPMATINLITATEQHQVAAHGFDAAICSREDSMCAAVLHEAQPVVLEDARTDARFEENPFVTGELDQVRFYAAHPLVTPAAPWGWPLTCWTGSSAREVTVAPTPFRIPSPGSSRGLWRRPTG
jgi:GAF domain-containing protein